MRLALILGAGAAAAFLLMPTTQTAEARYCANSDEAGRICGHASMDQCEATRAGLGGWCEEEQITRVQPRPEAGVGTQAAATARQANPGRRAIARLGPRPVRSTR
jgi:hypothetical protein